MPLFLEYSILGKYVRKLTGYTKHISYIKTMTYHYMYLSFSFVKKSLTFNKYSETLFL